MRKSLSSDHSAQEKSKLLKSVDILRSQGISHYISLPRIIVYGYHSSGKSSVIEAISDLAFSARSSLCTRFPTELILRALSLKWGCAFRLFPHSRKDIERHLLGTFCETIGGSGGLPALVENIKTAMGINTTGKAFTNYLLVWRFLARSIFFQ